MLKISFLTLFVCGVNITPDINPVYGSMDRLCPNVFNDNHRQRDKQTEFINRVKREHLS